MVGNVEEALKIFPPVGTTLDRQEIDDLNEELRLTVTSFAHRVDELLQSREKSIMTDAQQRPARNVANAGRFEYQCCGPAFRKSPIPIQIVVGDESILRRGPRRRRRYAGATLVSARNT